MKLEIGSHAGTGTYGKNNPTTVTFPFPIKFFVFPHGNVSSIEASTIAFMDQIPTNFPTRANVTAAGYGLYVKKSVDNKSLTWYNTDSVGKQLNTSNSTYYYLYGGYNDKALPKDQIITQSGTFTVEKTGKYNIELYGGGGAAYLRKATGGSSCQSYNEVQLTAGEAINVVIGAANGGTTTFGSYSVAGGGNASANAGGTGSGNLGRNGTFSSTPVQILYEKNISEGTYGSEYGYGGYSRLSEDNISYITVPGGSGAVYIHYLHA